MKDNKHQIKVAHESPKAIFDRVQKWTDYDYALVHLFEEDPEYLEQFKAAVQKGREVILDNSVFELEEAFDPERFVYWINELNPTWYIVPDVLEDSRGTMKNMTDWITKWKPKVMTDSKMIGVVQGKTYRDLEDCYIFMDRVAKVDKIAISFDYSYYTKSYSHPDKLISFMLGRVKFIGELMRSGVLNTEKPHHLLGCALPGEGIFYPSEQFSFIDSMDTSNPVVHGLKGIKYNGPLGLSFKNSTKLFTLINEEVSLSQWNLVCKNIQEFRRLWKGNYGI